MLLAENRRQILVLYRVSFLLALTTLCQYYDNVKAKGLVYCDPNSHQIALISQPGFAFIKHPFTTLLTPVCYKLLHNKANLPDWLCVCENLCSNKRTNWLHSFGKYVLFLNKLQ